jgi:hypothetical protein
MFLRVAPRTYKRYFVAPEYLRNVTFTVRPVNVHFTERNEGVTTTTGVAGAATGTVTTGDSGEPSEGVVVSSPGNDGTTKASD